MFSSGERLYGSVVTNTDQQREEAENLDMPSTSGLSSNACATSLANGSSATAGPSGISRQSVSATSSATVTVISAGPSSTAGPTSTSGTPPVLGALASQNGISLDVGVSSSANGTVCVNGTSEVFGNGVAPMASGSASEGESGEGEGSGPSMGAFILTQNCAVDQSATPLSPPVVSMATAHYTTLEEEDLPGNSHNHVPGNVLASPLFFLLLLSGR